MRRLIDRLLGRDREETTGDRPSLFTAHQPPPADGSIRDEQASPEGPDREEPSGHAGGATHVATVPVPETAPSEPDLFTDRHPPRQPDPRPEAEPEPRPEPQAEPRPEPRPEPQPEPQPEPRPEPQPEPGPEPEPGPAPEPAAGADIDDLQTAVHEDMLERFTPRSRAVPGVLVHDEHLDQRSGPVELTPSQAIELARGGRDALRRPDDEETSGLGADRPGDLP